MLRANSRKKRKALINQKMWENYGAGIEAGSAKPWLQPALGEEVELCGTPGALGRPKPGAWPEAESP